MTDEWMGYLIERANKSKHKEKYRKLKQQQFINGINDQTVMIKIIKESTVIKYTSEVTIYHKLNA